MVRFARFGWLVSLAMLAAPLAACSSDADDAAEAGDEENVTSRARAYVGTYLSRGRAGDFASLELKADGTYTAMVDAQIPPTMFCVRAPCLHDETGTFTVSVSRGQEKLRLTPSGSPKRTYDAVRASGNLSLSRGGRLQSLELYVPGLSCARARCTSNTRCEEFILEGNVQIACNPTATKVTGFDFSGPTVLDAAPAEEACIQILREEQAACDAIGGESRAAKGCRTVCSKPIARRGKVAGFSFNGFVVADPAPATEVCPAVVRAEEMACGGMAGETRAARGCAVVCSVPIAPNGRIAGFDFTGLVTLDAPPAGEVCAAVLSDEQAACERVSGLSHGARGCRTVCSAPIAR